jgi:hypothetical protein
MDIGVTLKPLGPVDSGALVEAILAQDAAAWQANRYRQQTYEVHTQTESLVMLFCDGWPDLAVTREAAWDALHETALPLMGAIIERHYEPGGTVIRAMAARLRAGGIIAPHRDTHPSFAHSHRIHVPVTTNHRVRFTINGRPHRFEPGHAYEINNQMNHSVLNQGAEDRITFIFDYLPPAAA